MRAQIVAFLLKGVLSGTFRVNPKLPANLSTLPIVVDGRSMNVASSREVMGCSSAATTTGTSSSMVSWGFSERGCMAVIFRKLDQYVHLNAVLVREMGVM